MKYLYVCMYVCMILLLVGCVSIPPKKYEISGRIIEIYVMEEEKVEEFSRGILGEGGERIGLFVPGNPVKIYIPYSHFKDKEGNNEPDFCVLGHEIWHLQELGGDFH